LLCHLAPALIDNLREVAGEWAMFSPEFLAGLVGSPPQPPLMLPEWLALEWRVVQQLVELPDLLEHQTLLSILARLYFEPQWRLQGPLSGLLEVSREAQQSWAVGRFSALFESLRLKSDAPRAIWLRNWAAWTELYDWLQARPGWLETCKHLEDAFLLKELARVPRGQQLAVLLQPHRERVQACLQGPMQFLYPDRRAIESNRAFLLGQGSSAGPVTGGQCL
jgi:hypothetical protein